MVDNLIELDMEIDYIRNMLHEKNKSYAKDGDPWSNLKLCQEMGMQPWQGVVVRLGDKICRLMQFAAKGDNAFCGEGVVDAFRDVVGYSLIGLRLFRESQDDTLSEEWRERIVQTISEDGHPYYVGEKTGCRYERVEEPGVHKSSDTYSPTQAAGC